MAALHRFAPQPLEAFVRATLEALETPPDIAAEVAGHLTRSNLSGHDSHGVMLLDQYAGQIDSGEFIAAARPKILRETEVAALIDARRGWGHYSTRWALDWALNKVHKHGLAAAAVRHSNHIGRVGEYAERAAERRLIAMVTAGAAGPAVGGMVLHGGSKRFLGANPWAIGVPAEGAPPFVFDASTSTIAQGKVRVARDKGASLPRHCIVGPQGTMSTDPADFYSGGALLPLGAPVAGHKGYGLALASALLSGLAMIGDPNPTLIGAEIHEKNSDPRGRIAGVFLIVVDPAAFGDIGLYREMIGDTLAAAKRVPPAKGVDEVLTPGEPERITREQRRREGIPLPEKTWQELTEVGNRVGGPFPSPLA